MKTEQQQIAIAEACGWTFTKQPRSNMMSQIPAWHLTSPTGEMQCGKDVWFDTHYGKESVYRAFQGDLVDYLNDCGVPDYLNDLNAMHEAEKRLSSHQRYLYIKRLGFNDGPQARVWNGGMHGYDSTAAQRAEAFLKTLNLWKP